MWAFFSSMTNKIILEFQRRRHHSNPFQIVFFNSHEHCCISIQSYKKLSWDREYNFELHWISILKSILLKSQPGGEMASSSRGFPTERLDACLGQFSREDNPTFTFSTVNFPNGVLKRRTIRLQLSLFPDENKAKEMNPSCFSDCRLAQCSLACSHHIHCSHLLHPQVLVVACFTFVVKKNYLTHLHTTCSI